MVPAGSGLRNFILSLSPTHWILIAFLVAMIPVIAVLAYFLGAGHDALSQDIEDQCGRVIYMNAMFRHGSRNTDATPPKDPYSDPMYWPGGFGALTAEGVLQHYRLGKWMRNRYSHLLPDDPADINEAIRIVSTDWNRTLMSAQAEMFGMFPITRDTDMWEGLTSYPVPIHTITTSEDALLEVTKKCKRYEALTQASIASEKYQSVMNKYQNMTSWIEENSGACIRTLNDYQDLYNNYFIEEGRGLKLPDWLREVYPSPMIEPAIISFEAPTWDDNMKRLRGGPFVKEVFGNFWGKLNGSNLLNMSMYSAHDTTLAAAMNTMGVFNEAPPPFAAMLLIELRMPVNSSEPFVTIWYKNTTSEPFLLEMPGCGSCCPLQQMEQNLKPIIPDDWEKECEEIPPEHGGTL